MSKSIGLIQSKYNDLIASEIEIQPGCLYFVTFKKSFQPANSSSLHYFNTDEYLIYESFYNDFGPLNICMLYHYCRSLYMKINAELKLNKRIIHYTSINPAKRLNAACLIGGYAVIYLNKTPEETYQLLNPTDSPAYTCYCDASYTPSNFKVSLFDCISALHKALKCGFIDFNDFDDSEYEYYERVENGDLNWIVPQKFIAFCGPHQKSKILPNGYPCHAPNTYFEYFHKYNITTVIRLNAKVYNASHFENAGFDHKDLFFVDGSTPSDIILKKFLSICENTKGAIAVHCKAGLGRTGSLIGAYIIKHYNFSALEAIAWLRLCRPGSVIGHQQQWLEEKQVWLWSEGERMRKNQSSKEIKHKFGIYSEEYKKKLHDAIGKKIKLKPSTTPVKKISQKGDIMHLDDKNLSTEQSNSNKSVECTDMRKFRYCSGTIIKSTTASKGCQTLTTNVRRRKCNKSSSSYVINLIDEKTFDSQNSNYKLNCTTMSSSDSTSHLKSEHEASIKKPNGVVHHSVKTSSLNEKLIKNKNYVTQGDKLNQIKALRRQSRTRTQQVWKCNANNISTTVNNITFLSEAKIDKEYAGKSFVNKVNKRNSKNNMNSIESINQPIIKIRPENANRILCIENKSAIKERARCQKL